jgi:conjugal transfer ATP-binding protein TraC
MAYEIPQQLEYREKIMFGLDFRQLAYGFTFGSLSLLAYKLPYLPLSWTLMGCSTIAGASFMFLNLDQHMKDWKSFMSFREALFMTKKMKQFIGIEKIENRSIFVREKTGLRKIAVIKVEPMNFTIRNDKEKDSVVYGFQKFLNSLDFPIQIVVQTDSINLDNYLNQLEKRVELSGKKSYLELLDSFRKHVSSIVKDSEVMDRTFYIAVPETGDIDIQTQVVIDKLSDIGLKSRQLYDDELVLVAGRMFNDFHSDEDKSELLREKITSKDLPIYSIQPKYIKNKINCIQINKFLNRVVSAVGYPRNVEPGFLDKLITARGNFDISIHIEPFPVETKMVVLNHELQKQRADLYSMEKKEIINPSLEIKYHDTRSVLEGLQKGQEKLFNVSLYINSRAKNSKELNLLTKKIEAELNCSMILPSVQDFKQAQGIKSMLPICSNALDIKRNVTTSALSAFFPFTSQFLQIDNSGIWFGLNKNSIPIIKDIFSFTNPNGCILASSGAGKSYTAKLMIARHILNGTKVMVIDPQNEYSALARQFSGQIVTISKDSETIINPMDLLGHDYSEKRLALLDLISVMIGNISEIQRAVLDKAITGTYRKKGITSDSDTWNKNPPIISDLVDELTHMSKSAVMMEKETYRSLINRLSMYSEGIFSFLNRHTKLDFKNDFVVFNIGDMPKQVKPVIMFMILDYVYTKMRQDKERKLLVIDEAWTLLARAEDASYIFEIVKTCRKFNLGLLLITQDVADLLNSSAGNALLANSSYTFLMRQKPAVIEQAVRAFQLSDSEKRRLLTAGLGEGVLITDNEHTEMKVIASEEEDRIITTKPDQMTEPEKKIQKPEPEPNIDADKGFYKKSELKPEEIDFLLKKGYIVSSHVSLGGGQRYDYLIKTRGNETAEHFFLIKAVEEYLKGLTNDVELFETQKPDIVFSANGKKWAFEIETGTLIKYNPEQFFKKIVKLKKEFGENWIVIVTKGDQCYTYSRYAKTYHRGNIERKIRSIFREKLPRETRVKKNTNFSAKNKRNKVILDGKKCKGKNFTRKNVNELMSRRRKIK